MKEVTDEEMVGGGGGDYYLQDIIFKIAFKLLGYRVPSSKYSPVSDVPAVSVKSSGRGTHASNRLICPSAQSTQ